MIDGPGVDALCAEHGGLVAAMVACPQVLAELCDLEHMHPDARDLLRQIRWAVAEGFDGITVEFATETVTAAIPGTPDTR